MLLSLHSILLFVCVQARPDSRQPLGISFVGIYQIISTRLFPADVLDGSSLPTLTLPYATYKAQSYDSKQDIYIFANIRFAAPPLDDLRWAPPAEPLHEPGIQDGSIGGTCYQSTPAQVNFPREGVNNK
jgi:hypothetical protein